MVLQAGIPLIERDLRGEPLSEAELRALLDGRPASVLYSRRARQNRSLGIDPDQLTDDELIALMAREPTLIRRPTLVAGGEILAGPTRAELAAWVQQRASDGGSR